MNKRFSIQRILCIQIASMLVSEVSCLNKGNYWEYKVFIRESIGYGFFFPIEGLL